LYRGLRSYNENYGGVIVENNIFQKIMMALFFTVIVVIVSYFGFGFLLNVLLSYTSVEASFHLPTHALLIGSIFTVILCTVLILERLNKK
jgi:hypothetical protein